MKKLIAALCLATVLVSCGNEQAQTDNTTTDTTPATDAPVVDANAKIDPSCGMEYDASWVDYSVSENDTTWFCNEGCKTKYLALQSKDEDHDGHSH